MYRALVFDLGKVIFDYSWSRTFMRWSDLSGLPAAEIEARFQFTEEFAQFERGNLSAGAFRRHVSALLGFPFSAAQFEEGWNHIYMGLFPGTEELLAGLKKNYRLAALSNTNSVHEKCWEAKFADALSHFEKIFTSHGLHARKPEPAAFIPVLDYLQVRAQEVIFLDDLQVNAQAARKLGMHTILVQSPAQMQQDLRAAGIEW